MKGRMVVLSLLALLLAIPASTQTLPAPNNDVNVAVSTSYVHFTNGLQGTMIEAHRPITDYWSLGYAQVIIPAAKSNFYLLGPRYDTDLAHVFRKAKPSKLDLSLIKVFAGAGLGSRRDDLGGNPAFAYGFHGGLGIPAGKVLGATMSFSVSAGMVGSPSRGPSGPNHFFSVVSGANGNFAAGLSFTF